MVVKLDYCCFLYLGLDLDLDLQCFLDHPARAVGAWVRRCD
eukprot:COSAG01_NODE_18889_length_1046_cov_1.282999_2_plen_41_part_00